MKWIAESALLIGFAAITYGCYRMWEPFGWTVGGFFLCLWGVAAHSSSKEKK